MISLCGRWWILVITSLILLGSASTGMGQNNDSVISLEPQKPPLPSPASNPETADSNQSGDKIPTWQARWELAKLLSYSKRFKEAEAQYNLLLAEKPELHEAKAELARVLYWDGRAKESLKLLESIPAGQDSAQTLLLKADLLTADKRYAQAEGFYLAHLEKSPQDLSARFRLAQVLSWQGKYPQSLEQYRQILAQRPNDLQVRRHYALVLSWAGEFEKAAKEFEATLPRE